MARSRIIGGQIGNPRIDPAPQGTVLNTVWKLDEHAQMSPL